MQLPRQLDKLSYLSKERYLSTISMPMFYSSCMVGDEEGCFQHVSIPDEFIRAAGRGPVPNLWNELKTALNEARSDPDSSHTKVDFRLTGVAYNEAELAACDELAQVFVKIKPRHVKHLVFSMRHGAGLQVAERVIAGAKIKNVTLQSHGTSSNVFSPQDGQALANILPGKQAKTIEYRGLVFDDAFFDATLSATLGQTNIQMTFK